MIPDAIKQAHDRGYAKGYAAGRRRKTRDLANERRMARETALWQRALLAAIPFAMEQSTWKRGEKPFKTITERMDLAAEVADAAVGGAKRRCRV